MTEVPVFLRPLYLDVRNRGEEASAASTTSGTISRQCATTDRKRGSNATEVEGFE